MVPRLGSGGSGVVLDSICFGSDSLCRTRSHRCEVLHHSSHPPDSYESGRSSTTHYDNLDLLFSSDEALRSYLVTIPSRMDNCSRTSLKELASSCIAVLSLLKLDLRKIWYGE